MPPVQALRRQILRSVFERGYDFEDSYGKETLDPGMAHPERGDYEASSWLFVPRALRGRPITAADGFLDYGSGKGRVVHQAARYPFGRVLGLEISETLADVAERSVQRNRQRFTCPRVEIVCADVVDFEVPDDITYAYFYNPFSGDTFRSALDGLIASLDRRPRDLRLLYWNPVMAQAVIDSGRFFCERERTGLRNRPERTLTVYRSLPG